MVFSSIANNEISFSYQQKKITISLISTFSNMTNLNLHHPFREFLILLSFILQFTFVNPANSARPDTSAVAASYRVTVQVDNESGKNPVILLQDGDIEKVFQSDYQRIVFAFRGNDTIYSRLFIPSEKLHIERNFVSPWYLVRPFVRDSLTPDLEWRGTDTLNGIPCFVYADSINRTKAWFRKKFSSGENIFKNITDLEKVIVREKGYAITRTKIRQEIVADTLKLFTIDTLNLYSPVSLCLNADSLNQNISEIMQCRRKKAGRYPGYLSFRNMGGKVILSFTITREGEIINPVLEPVYYKYHFKYKTIAGKKKIARINRAVSKPIIRHLMECAEEIKLVTPLSGKGPVNTVIKIPLSFTALES